MIAPVAEVRRAVVDALQAFDAGKKSPAALRLDAIHGGFPNPCDPEAGDVGAAAWDYIVSVEDARSPEEVRRMRLRFEGRAHLAAIDYGDEWLDEYRWLVEQVAVERARLGQHRRQVAADAAAAFMRGGS